MTDNVFERDPWEVFHGAAALDDEIFGRDTDLETLLKRVLSERFRCGALWGETGTGKSSLLRAGLVPRLERLGHLTVIVDRWENPAAAVRQALASSRALDPEAVAERREAKRKVVLFCDQFERVFDAIRTQDERASFLEELARPINDPELPFCCVFALRADRLYHLFELDRWVPHHRPLATENLYQLRYLRQSDAVRVFEQLRGASGSEWTDELLGHVVQDLADDTRVRPVEIQLIAAGFYLHAVRTAGDYNLVGRKEGLLKGYLDSVLAEIEYPELGRHIVRGLVASASPAVRVVKPLGEIVDAVKGRRDAVDATLEELAIRHVVQSIDEESPPRWELVHDVLCEACWRAATPSEMGLSVLRPALRRGRRWLSLPDYRRALRADFSELPEVPRKRARRLLRLTEAFIGVRALLLVFLVLVGIQFSFAHVRIESDHPYPIRVYRGLRILDGLPAPLGRTVLFDTGLIDEDVHASLRNELLAMSLRVWDGARSERTRRLHTLGLSPRRLCLLGHWEEGTEILLRQQFSMSPSLHTERLRTLAAASDFEPQLSRLLGVPRASLRARAVAALGQIDLSAVEVVIPQVLTLLGDPVANVRSAAAETLGEIGAADVAAVAPQLLTLLNDPNSYVRIAAAEALTQLGAADAATVMPQLLISIQDNDSNIRRAAASALGRIGMADAAAVMSQLLTLIYDHDSEVRIASAKALGQIGTADAATVLPQLLTLIHDDNSFVRQVAAETLGQIGAADATTVISQLLTLVDDREWNVREAVAKALGKIGAADAATVVPQLLVLIKDSASYVPSAAAKALGQISAADTAAMVPQLLTLIQDSDSDIRAAAAEVLGQIDTADAAAVVPQLLTLIQDNDLDVRAAAAEALGRIGAADAATVVPQLLTLVNSGAQYAAAKALGQIGAANAATVVPQLLFTLTHGRSPNSRGAAAEALGQIGATDAATLAPRLFFTLNKESDPSVRQAAAEAWVRLKSLSAAPLFPTLLAELQGDESRLDGHYREGTVLALQFWFQEGNPPMRDSAEPAGESPWTEKARQEHDALAAELERLRELDRPWWLRVAAWDVFLGPYGEQEW